MRAYEFLVRFVWILTYFTVKPLLRVFYSFSIHLDPSVLEEAKYPAIIISNHKSVLDPWLVLLCFPFRQYKDLLPIRILGAKKFSYSLSRVLEKIGIVSIVYFFYGVLGIDKSKPYEEKVRLLTDALKAGDTVFLFPEGHINSSNTINDLRRGIIDMHQETKVPIIPCSIRFFPGWRKKCVVNIGQAFQIEDKILRSTAGDVYHTEGCNFVKERLQNLYNNYGNFR